MNYGVMQGRLSPRQFPKLNAFPHDSWKDEFSLAAKLQLSSIEWIFEEESYEENPIWTSAGRSDILRLIKETGVKVSSLCADYFLPRHFYQEEIYDENINLLKELIQKSAEVGVSLILLPVLEEAELRTPEDRKKLIFAVGQCLDTLRKCGVQIGLETELPALDYLELVRDFNSECVGAYYDAGNSAYRGYDMKQDFEILLPVLLGVHLKDRPINGKSVYIGHGTANFKEGMPYLRSNNYSGHLIFQSFFEHTPYETMRGNIEIMKRFEGEDA